ncbi:hypothetical protein [Nostoc sp. FACHB-110]|uniref:hypothetical protein n=1 Tax=Nostoc sp. FACHB-110 TaxID=2692834 RepID=UPI001683C590|nr:hypothetical protein [Nostoc sp. FACHB-110]MBD2440833.1 hypothetical protein [Nostoc sp. FACHB-110]
MITPVARHLLQRGEPPFGFQVGEAAQRTAHRNAVAPPQSGNPPRMLAHPCMKPSIKIPFLQSSYHLYNKLCE